jgi:hypothetical protein
MAYPLSVVDRRDIIGQGVLDVPIPGKKKGEVVLAGQVAGAPTALVRGELGDIVVKTAYGETYAKDDSPTAIGAAIARMREIVAASSGNK